MKGWDIDAARDSSPAGLFPKLGKYFRFACLGISESGPKDPLFQAAMTLAPQILRAALGKTCSPTLLPMGAETFSEGRAGTPLSGVSRLTELAAGKGCLPPGLLSR